MKTVELTKYVPILLPIPAVGIGAITMSSLDLSAAIWGQNLVTLLIAVLVSGLLIVKGTNNRETGKKDKRDKKDKSSIDRIEKDRTDLGFLIPLSILLLGATFWDAGIDGVHRWISIGSVKLYVASIIVPLLIIELSRVAALNRWWMAAANTVAVALAFALQPDASHMTAFIIPLAIILWRGTSQKLLQIGTLIVATFLIAYSWINIDQLSPVSYVEQIVELAGSMGIFWLFLALLSLLALPLPFFLLAPESSKRTSFCLGIYFLLLLISTRFGNFPVPLMGYGISPIIGYFIAATWLVKAKVKERH